MVRQRDPPRVGRQLGGDKGGIGKSAIKGRLYRGETGSEVLMSTGGDGPGGRQGRLPELVIHGQCPIDVGDGRPSNHLGQGAVLSRERRLHPTLSLLLGNLPNRSQDLRPESGKVRAGGLCDP